MPGIQLTEPQLVAVVHRFYDLVYAHPRLGHFFRGIRRGRQEQRLTAFVRMASAGWEDPFHGQFLREAHAHLFITADLFDVRAGLLEEAIRAEGHGDEVVHQWLAFDEGWRGYVVKDRIEECISEWGVAIVSEPT